MFNPVPIQQTEPNKISVDESQPTLYDLSSCISPLSSSSIRNYYMQQPLVYDKICLMIRKPFIRNYKWPIFDSLELSSLEVKKKTTTTYIEQSFGIKWHWVSSFRSLSNKKVFFFINVFTTLWGLKRQTDLHPLVTHTHTNLAIIPYSLML